MVYRSKAGWSGAWKAPPPSGSTPSPSGVVSDGDTLAERYSGILARYEDKRLGTDRVRFRCDFESYHDSGTAHHPTRLAQLAQCQADTSGIYRTAAEFRARR